MRPRTPLNSPRPWLAVLLAAAALTAAASAALAAPVAGFQENFPGTGIGSWGGGPAVYDNPGTGGANGLGDGYLRMTQSTVFHFGARALGSEYAGDWLAAGIQKVRVALNDIGTDEAFEIHFCIGNNGNFWLYTPVFNPPSNAWQDFEVDLTAAGSFTRIIGSGTFTQALQSADRILLRHDLPPYVMSPESISGDMGVDRIELVGVPVSTSTTTWGRLKALYRD